MAWGLTISTGNSSTVSVSYHNSTGTPLLSNTTILHTETLSEANISVPLTTSSSARHDGPYLSSGFTTSVTAHKSGHEVFPMTDRNGNTTRSPTTAYLTSNSTLNSTSATKTFPTTGSGFFYASQCESLTRDWWSTSSKWFSSNSYSSMAVNTMRATTTLYSEDVVPVTLTSCLGQSRQMGGQTLAQSSTGEIVTTMLYSYLTPVASSYTVPMPTCTFDTDSCNFLWDEYDAYWNLAASVWPAAPTITRVPDPMCSPYRPNAYCSKCTIEGNWADVYYWPMEVVGEPCDPNRSFVTATPTIPGQPNTIVFGTNTFISPTVYVSVPWMKATNSDGNYCGGQYYSTFMPFRPEEVSSIRFSLIDNGWVTERLTFDQGTTTEYGTITTMNFTVTATATVPVSFGDFMGAVPAAAYSAQSPLNFGPGATPTDDVITDVKYTPRIYLPERVRSMDPYWSNCEVFLHGVSDPPVALTAASTVVRPVLPTWTTTVNVPVPSSTIPAEPAGQPETPHASVTQSETSQSRTTSTAGAVETGGPAEPSRTSSRVNPSSVDPPTNDQSSQGSSPQNSPPVVVIPVPDAQNSRNEDLDPSDIPGPTAATLSSGSPQADQDSTTNQQSITRIATSRQTSLIITLGSSRLPVIQSGSVAVVGDRTLTVGGSTVVIQGQQISLEPSGLRVESSQTVRFSSAPTQTSLATATAVWNDGGISVKVFQESNAILLTSGTGTTAITFGKSAIVNGHRVDAPSSGGMIVIDGAETILLAPEDASRSSSIQLSGPSVQLSIPSTSGEKTITAERLSSNRVRLTSGSESIIVANGASAVIAGSTVTVLADGSGVVVSGSSLIPLSDPVREKAGERLPSDSFAAVDSGRYILVEHGHATVTLADAAVTVVDGHTISAARDGEYMVIDGSVTRSVETSSTRVPGGEGSRIVADAEATNGVVTSGSAGHSVSSMGTWRKILTSGLLVVFVMH
jgi:hypothetical protein